MTEQVQRRVRAVGRRFGGIFGRLAEDLDAAIEGVWEPFLEMDD